MPALLRQDKAAGSQEFTATLFDLIRRKRYTSTPVNTERKVWGGLRHEQVADLLLEVGDTNVELKPFEEPVADVIDSVLDADGERLSELRSKIEERPDREREAVHRVQVAGRDRDRPEGLVRRQAGQACSGSLSAPSSWPPSSCSGSASTAGARPHPAGATSCWSRSAGARSPTPSSLARRDHPRAAVAAADEGRRDGGGALGCIPPLPDRLPPAPGGAAGDARAVGAVPRLRHRVRNRRARAPGCAPPHARGAARPEHDLLDQPDRRPRLGRRPRSRSAISAPASARR